MTLEETAKIIASIGKMYPSWVQGRDIDGTIRLWQKVFADDDAQAVGQALGIHFSTDTKGFAPVPGQLKEILAQMRQEDGELTEHEAWRLVSKACSRAIYNAREEFEKLPPVCQQVVHDPETLNAWAMMDSDQVETVIASNFMRSYRVRAEQAREWNKLPSSMRGLLPVFNAIGALPSEKPEALPAEIEAVEIPDEAKALIMGLFPERAV